MKFHVIGLPHTVTSKEYSACAFTQKVFKFIAMMSARGHDIIHYGHEESKVNCKSVTVTTNKDLEIAYGSYDWKKGFFKHQVDDHAHVTFCRNTVREIEKRHQPTDIILPFWGAGVQRIIEADSVHFAYNRRFNSVSLYIRSTVHSHDSGTYLEFTRNGKTVQVTIPED
jgi:hypothetical protein